MDNIKLKVDYNKAIDSRDIEKRMENTSEFVSEKVKRTLSKPGTGAVYVRDGKMHRASAPGQPPAKDTGTLQSSIEYKVTKDGETISGLIGSSADYAIYLEFGTSRMAARPFLRPVLENNKEEIVDKFVGGGK